MEPNSSNSEPLEGKDSNFYLDAAQYWASIPPTGKHNVMCL